MVEEEEEEEEEEEGCLCGHCCRCVVGWINNVLIAVVDWLNGVYF